MAPETEDPADDLTVLESNDTLESQGYTAQFAAIEGGDVRCFACRTVSPASAFQIHALNRSEGASDPDEMVAVVAASCPACSAKGTMSLSYGPEASLEDAEVLKTLEDVRTAEDGGTAT